MRETDIKIATYDASRLFIEFNAAPSCPAGWTEWSGGCYKYFAMMKKEKEAEDYCSKEQVFTFYHIQYFDLISYIFFCIFRLTWFLFTQARRMSSSTNWRVVTCSILEVREPVRLVHRSGPGLTTHPGTTISGEEENLTISTTVNIA